MEINKLKTTIEKQDTDICQLSTELNMAKNDITNLDDEMEEKNKENNNLRAQVVNLDQTVKDLYCSRKGNGTQQIELDSVKADNERLLELLKGTCEYGDMDDSQIIKAANSLRKTPSALNKSTASSKRASSAKGGFDKSANDWIPTDAVKAIYALRTKLKDTKGIELPDNFISSVLYQLNQVWRNIMRNENEAIKKRLNA